MIAGGRRTLGVMLSQIESQIARLIAEDLSDGEIVRELHIPEQALVRHLLHIFYECKVSSRHELSAYVRSSRSTGPSISHSSGGPRETYHG